MRHCAANKAVLKLFIVAYIITNIKILFSMLRQSYLFFHDQDNVTIAKLGSGKKYVDLESVFKKSVEVYALDVWICGSWFRFCSLIAIA